MTELTVSDDPALNYLAAKDELEEILLLWRRLKKGEISLEKYHEIMSLNFPSGAE